MAATSLMAFAAELTHSSADWASSTRRVFSWMTPSVALIATSSVLTSVSSGLTADAGGYTREGDLTASGVVDSIALATIKVSALLAALGFLALLWTAFLLIEGRYAANHPRTQQTPDALEQLDALLGSLATIEADVSARSAELAEVEAARSRAEALLTASRPQLEAARDVLERPSSFRGKIVLPLGVFAVLLTIGFGVFDVIFALTHR